jgi:hypothetical protein
MQKEDSRTQLSDKGAENAQEKAEKHALMLFQFSSRVLL